MRKLDLRNYQYTEKVQNPVKGVEEVTLPFLVKESILNIMFLPTLGLQGAELVRQNVLAMKIEQAEDEVLLEEEEYQRVKKAAENYKAQSRADVGLIDRILNKTQEIESEKQPLPPPPPPDESKRSSLGS